MALDGLRTEVSGNFPLINNMMPAHKPTEENRNKVVSYARVGIPQEDIARVLDIDPKTLRLHYRDELDKASIEANSKVGGALYEKALSGDTASMIWWTKARMRWSEKKEIEHSGELTKVDKDMSLDEATRTYEDNLRHVGG